MAELLGMMLDFLDAVGGAVGIAYWWCTWVRPARPPDAHAPPGEGPEIERFLGEVRACPGGTKLYQ